MTSRLPDRLVLWLRRYARARGGATAVEFSMIALPFFALLFGILELGIVYVLSVALDNATNTVSREIRTGQIASSSYNNASGFRAEICKRMGWAAAADCASNPNLAVEVKKMTTYTQPASPFVNGEFKQDLAYETTKESEIVMVRAYYKWKVITPLLNKALVNTSDGSRLVSSVLVFRNEPYGS